MTDEQPHQAQYQLVREKRKGCLRLCYETLADGEECFGRRAGPCGGCCWNPRFQCTCWSILDCVLRYCVCITFNTLCLHHTCYNACDDSRCRLDTVLVTRRHESCARCGSVLLDSQCTKAPLAANTTIANAPLASVALPPQLTSTRHVSLQPVDIDTPD